MSKKKSEVVYKPLPFKASEMLEIALHDLEVIEKLPGYRIDMSTWHEAPSKRNSKLEDKCSVCFAGSVMAISLKTKKNETCQPENFGPVLARQLRALDDFRCGDVYDGLCRLYGYMADELMDQYSHLKASKKFLTYDVSPRDFKKGIRKIIKDLQKAGV